MKIPKLNFQHLTEVLEFLIESEKRSMQPTVESVIRYCQKSRGYTQNSLEMLELMQVVEINADIIKLKEAHIDKLASNQIEGSILGFQPFVEFLYFLSKGKSLESSASMVKHLYEIENSTKNLVDTFQAMRSKLGMDKVVLASKESLLNKEADLKDRTVATLYIKERLDTYYHELPSEIIKDFIVAIQVSEMFPSQAVNDAGRGLEDFLRIVLVKDLDLKKRAGLGQIAIALNENQVSYPGKLNNLLSGLASIRSMGDAHGADKKILERWVVTPESARAFITLCLNTMRGYLTFKHTKKLIC